MTCASSIDYCFQAFIGQSVQDPLLVNVRAALHHGNLAEAVRLLRQEKQLSLLEAKTYIAEVRGAVKAGNGEA